MAKSESSSSGGIGFFGALALLFIGLKLGGVINWSWWWVLLPIYGGIVLFFVVLFGVYLYAKIAERQEKRQYQKAKRELEKMSEK